MAEKKRKGADSSTAQPSKKTKKSVKIASEPVVVAEDVTTILEPESTDVTSTKPKKTRKRAADFLYDEPETNAPEPKKGKKEAKASKESKSLTADGSNGIIEHSDDEDITITTTKSPKNKSMMAEAERTQDAELAEEFGNAESKDEDIDTAPALLTGFDSDNEDTAEDKNFDASRVAPIPQFKKTSKKLRQAKEAGNDGPGVVYIGRIPHGFYEAQMREYFSQFGNIKRLRLSRNKKTGASKHFAFIEFESEAVAKIVADTMDNYLMFGHILKCKYAPSEALHTDVWKGADKKFRRIPTHKLLKQKAEEPKTEAQIDKKIKKVQGKRTKKLEQMKQLGYEINLPTLVKPDVNARSLEADKEEPLAIEDKVEGALVPPPTVPKDEVAVRVEENKKKEKKSKKSSDKSNGHVEKAEAMNAADESVPADADQAVTKKTKKSAKKAAAPEDTPIVPEQVVAAVEEPTAKKGKKSKKTALPVEPVAEQVTVVEEAAPKKGRKAKKEAVIEETPVVAEAVAVAVEEAPKKSKKSKKVPEEAIESTDKKQLKSILKKSKKA